MGGTAACVLSPSHGWSAVRIWRRSGSREAKLCTALGAVALAAALVGARWLPGHGDGGDGTASGDCGGKIAFFGAFTGDDAGLVHPSLNGAKLAVKQFNEANPNCKVTMQEFDTAGRPGRGDPGREPDRR